MKIRACLASLAALLLLASAPARADYVIKDGNGTSQTIKAGTVGSFILPQSTMVDSAGNSIFTAPGTPNASFAMPIQGVTGGAPVPISVGSLPLPSGAATAAKQPALGTAGTPSADVISVQGVAGGTAQPVTMASLPAFASTPAFNLSQIGGAALAFGQAAATSSIPVVLANDTRPGAGTITIVDSASSSTTGQNSASIITGTPTASSSVTQAVNGLSMVRFQRSNTGTGTISFEQSIDGGTTYGALACHGNGTIYSLSAITGNGIFDCEAAGATHVRARATSAVSGTITITMTLTIDPGILKILNSVAIKDNASGASLTVKPASTAAAATDSSAVVQMIGTLPGFAAAPSFSLVDATGAITAAVMGASTPALPTHPAVAIRECDGCNGTLGSQADPAATDTTGSWSIESLLKYLINVAKNPLGAQAGTGVNIGNVGGLAASGAAVAGNPVLQGGRAQNAEQAAVTNGQAVAEATDLVGKRITLPYANPENGLVGQVTSAMTATTSTALTGMGAQGSGFRVYLTGCTFSNSHATVGTMILIQDGSGGATLWQAPAAPSFGGAQVQFPTPIKTTANTGAFAVNVTTGASTFVSCTGYKGI